MSRSRVIFSLITLVVSVFVLFAASCITIVDEERPGAQPGSSGASPKASGADSPPNVTAFSASAAEVDGGQSLSFTFTVTDDVGLNRVELWRADETAGVNWREVSRVPASGKSFSGTLSDTPTSAGTYSYGIHVVDSAEKWNSEINIQTGSKPGVYGPKKVVVKGASRPDLIVTEIKVVVREIYFKTRNAGNAEAKGCRAYLYVDGLKQADEYIEALAPGQERDSPFHNYAYPYLGSGEPEYTGQAMVISDYAQSHTLKVCADVENTIVEGNEGNNCTVLIWGKKFNYSFTDFAHQALWTTGYGVLQLPLPEESMTGAAMVAYQAMEDNRGYGASLVTIPQQVSGGWIQGKFGGFYMDENRQPRVKDITIPDMSKFTAEVGFAASTPPGSKAKFMFGAVDESGVVTFAPAVTASMDGKLDSYVVDLSSLALQKRQFIIRVEIIGSPEKVKPVWIDPRVLQP